VVITSSSIRAWSLPNRACGCRIEHQSSQIELVHRQIEHSAGKIKRRAAGRSSCSRVPWPALLALACIATGQTRARSRRCQLELLLTCAVAARSPMKTPACPTGLALARIAARRTRARPHRR
jgi:hypothetical protein